MLLQEKLNRGDVVIMDGAMGTELEKRGAPMDKTAWSARALLTHPHLVTEIHEDYINAGAEIIIANSFSTARHVLEPAGLGKKVHECNLRAIELAKKARQNTNEEVYVAASISSMTPGEDQSSIPSPEELLLSYQEQADIFREEGADLIILEMMRNRKKYIEPALKAAESTDLPVWLGFSCEMQDEQVMLMDKNEKFTKTLDNLLSNKKPSLYGIMHTQVEDTIPALKEVKKKWPGVMASYPHSGEFKMPNWQFENIISPEDFLKEAEKWAEMGVQVIGGCCGIGPDHIKMLSENLPEQIPTK